MSAPDSIFAGMKGLTIARMIVEQDSLRIGDYSGWDVIVDVEGQERFQERFPLE